MKRKSKNILIAFLSILAIASVGTTTAAILTNGFHRSYINDIINANKKDYVQIDLSNKYKELKLQKSRLNYQINIKIHMK